MEHAHEILVAEASETLGSLHLALKWLHSPCACMDHRIPAEVAKSKEGFKEVLDILYRIRSTIVHRPSPDSTWFTPRGMAQDVGSRPGRP